MFKINLVPEIQKNKNTTAKLNSYATIFSTVLVIATVSVLVIMYIVTETQKAFITKTDNSIQRVKDESEQYKELEETVISLEKGLNNVKKTLGYENNWTLLLPHLEGAMPKDARYGRLIIEDGNLISAEIIGKSIDGLARFLESYKSYHVISMSGSAAPGETVSIYEGDVATQRDVPDVALEVVPGDDEIENEEEEEKEPTTINLKTIQSFKVGPNGKWIRAIKIDPKKDASFTIRIGESEMKVKYEAETKNITTEGAVSAEVAKLFTEIETTRYTKKGQQVTFDATFKFESRLLW